MIAPSALEERRVLAVALPRLRETYGVASIEMFGSRVRVEQPERSDRGPIVGGESLTVGA
jgi:predicted nucleotidyltransferase